MKKETQNSKLTQNKEKKLTEFIKEVKKGKYTKNKINSDMRVSVYVDTNTKASSYTFGVR